MTNTTRPEPKRYFIMSVPKNDDTGAFWFVCDAQTRTTEEAPTREAAIQKVRALNASA